MSKPNLQQIPVSGNPGREVVRRFLGLEYEPETYDESDWDDLDPWPDDDEDSEDGNDLEELDSECLPGVPL